MQLFDLHSGSVLVILLMTSKIHYLLKYTVLRNWDEFAPLERTIYDHGKQLVVPDAVSLRK